MPTALLRGSAAALLTLTLAACSSTSTPTTSTPAPTTSEPAQSVRLAAQAVATPVALTTGQTLQLNVTVNGQPAQPGQLKWTTSNAGVATVTQTGLVTAASAGSATIRAALATNPGAFIDFPVAVTAPAPAPTPAPTPAPAPAPTTPGSFAQQVLDLTNAARAVPRSCGATSFAAAPALTWNAQLAQAAQGHAADMAAQNYFSHTSKDGRTFSQRIVNAGYSTYRTIGENIAAGQTTPQQVVDGWLKSEGHCRNIMNPNFKELGVGYAYTTTSTYKHYWVQDFGAR
ncbi:CAP domain-containing protein [Deinococcus sedimenti]|nr:CAP domain-containing protein [Deinococcus sedimenti]